MPNKKWHACDPGQPSAPPSSCAAANIVHETPGELIIVTRDGAENSVMGSKERNSPERKPQTEEEQKSVEKMRPPAVRPPPKAPLKPEPIKK